MHIALQPLHKTMKSRLFIGLLVTSSILPVAHSATTYWANYQPSLNPPTALSDAWPRSRTVLDQASLDSLGPGNKYIGAYEVRNPFNTIAQQGITSEFTVPETFTASHMTIPISFAGSLNNTLLDILINRFDGTSFVPIARTFVRTAQVAATGNPYFDYTIKFGSNGTSVASLFEEAPLTLEQGERYQISFTGRTGGGTGIGGFRVRDSLVSGLASNTGEISRTGDGTPIATVNNLDFAPAFAFNDGENALIPEPTTALLGSLGVFALLRRRRLC